MWDGNFWHIYMTPHHMTSLLQLTPPKRSVLEVLYAIFLKVGQMEQELTNGICALEDSMETPANDNDTLKS